MNEIGVGGLNLEVVMDNEASLQSLVNAALMKSNCRSFHPRHVAVGPPQAERLERFAGICREGVFAKVRLALEAPVLGYLIGHVYRMLFSLEKAGRLWNVFEEYADLRHPGRILLDR